MKGPLWIHAILDGRAIFECLKARPSSVQRSHYAFSVNPICLIRQAAPDWIALSFTFLVLKFFLALYIGVI
ncbi:MAG: hypothetical protein ACJAUP_003347 [Cellvibrionaceae bacterium]|jgi:hypothetical protein